MLIQSSKCKIQSYSLKFEADKGFTLVELILVVLLITIVTAMSASFYSRFFLQNEVANVSDQLVGELRKAQIYSMMGRQGGKWGVHYGSNAITLFQGDTYDGRNGAFDETFPISSTVSVSGLNEITFARMSGIPSSTPTIIISGNNNTKTISVKSQGTVNRED